MTLGCGQHLSQVATGNAHVIKGWWGLWRNWVLNFSSWLYSLKIRKVLLSLFPPLPQGFRLTGGESLGWGFRRWGRGGNDCGFVFCSLLIALPQRPVAFLGRVCVCPRRSLPFCGGACDGRDCVAWRAPSHCVGAPGLVERALQPPSFMLQQLVSPLQSPRRKFSGSLCFVKEGWKRRVHFKPGPLEDEFCSF